jgi:hypothetical protein
MRLTLGWWARVEEDGLIDLVRKRAIYRPGESATRQRSEGQLRELLWSLRRTEVALLLRQPWPIQTQNTWTHSEGEVKRREVGSRITVKFEWHIVRSSASCSKARVLLISLPPLDLLSIYSP